MHAFLLLITDRDISNNYENDTFENFIWDVEHDYATNTAIFCFKFY